MRKKLSIVTVVYNGERFIENAINSVISQKNEQVEYIIVDGGSTDSTLNIIEKYKNKIDIFISEKDKGIYDAMNKGWSKATGEYVAFLNSDDFYQPGLLNSVLNETNKNPDMIVTNTLIQDGEGKRKLFNRVTRKEDYKLHLRLPFMHPSVFIKKCIISKHNGFSLNYKIASDCDLLLKVLNESISIEYVNAYIVMRLGGVSDVNYKLGRKEYRDIYFNHFNRKIKANIGYV
ncbi:glycosyltransferase family 2 protein, partial [Escherichia coli]